MIKTKSFNLLSAKVKRLFQIEFDCKRFLVMTLSIEEFFQQTLLACIEIICIFVNQIVLRLFYLLFIRESALCSVQTACLPGAAHTVFTFTLTCIFQNVPDSVKFCHPSLSSMMLFGLSNKLILFVFHYQTPWEKNRQI